MFVVLEYATTTDSMVLLMNRVSKVVLVTRTAMLFGVLRLRQEIKETDGRSLMSQNMNALYYYVWRFCPVVHALDMLCCMHCCMQFVVLIVAGNFHSPVNQLQLRMRTP